MKAHLAASGFATEIDLSSGGLLGQRPPDPKIYEVDPLICPRCGGRMRVVAFLTEYAVVDRIIRHLELTFAAAKPQPARAFEQVVLMAAEESGDYE